MTPGTTTHKNDLVQLFATRIAKYDYLQTIYPISQLAKKLLFIWYEAIQKIDAYTSCKSDYDKWVHFFAFGAFVDAVWVFLF